MTTAPVSSPGVVKAGKPVPSMNPQDLLNEELPASLNMYDPLPALPVVNTDPNVVDPLEAQFLLRTQTQMQMQQMQTLLELATGWIKVKDIERMTAELKLEKFKKDAAAKPPTLEQ
eukprot:961489-Pyramimonas_sp.AAC.1